jgi:hypothetical protein
MDDKTLVIMRGLSWTGKSTRAREILEESPATEKGIFSTDDFFYSQVKPEKPEEYSFNRRFLAQAHKWNLLRVQDSIHWSWPLIIVDNTNSTLWEPRPYVEYADINGYNICIEEPTSDRWLEIVGLLQNKRANKKALKEWAAKLAEGSKDNHSVPHWAIEQMMWRWETNMTVERILYPQE